MIYWFFRQVGKWMIYIKFRIKVIGLEHIPKQGEVILAANHVSNYDPIILASIINRKIHFLAKKELFSNVISNWFFTKIQAIPVDRTGVVIKAVRQSLRVLENGEVFGIFPEGTRCKNGEMIQPKKGVAFFSIKTEAPIIPIALVNISNGLWKPIQVIIGKPMKPWEYDTMHYLAISQMVMKRIRELKEEIEEMQPVNTSLRKRKIAAHE